MRAMRRMMVLIGVGLATLLSAGGVARAADLGPNVMVFDPSMPTERDPGERSTRSPPSRSPTQFGHAALRAAVQARHLRHAPTQPLTFQVGYYTEVAGLGASRAT